MPPEVCPHCGAIVPRHVKACPECGSDETTGWSDSAHAGNLGIPEEKFDYEAFVKEELAPRRPRPRGVRWIWWGTALLLVLLFLYFWFRTSS